MGWANSSKVVCAAGLVAAIGLMTGCGGRYDASVKGAITFDGKPLPRGTVKFVPRR